MAKEEEQIHCCVWNVDKRENAEMLKQGSGPWNYPFSECQSIISVLL